MASEDQHQPHFILIPLMAQGHILPMIDMARMFANRGVLISLITTPINASRNKTVVDRAIQSGLPIRLVQLNFRCLEVGLPDGCENFDLLPSPQMVYNFFDAIYSLQEPVEQFLKEQSPLPSCIISDMCLPWTTETAHKFGIPRIVFNGPSCFSLLSMYNIFHKMVHDSVASDSEPFIIPDMPRRITITKAQIPQHLVGHTAFAKINEKIREGELGAYGVVINSFDELESEFIEKYRETIGKKTWCVGPVSLCNKDTMDKAERGNRASVDESKCLSWLDSKKPNSVVYACFGSLTRLRPPHLIEIGLGLEASNRPFIWVFRVGGKHSSDVEKWLSEGFEERVKDRGLIIRGWAPQILILSHPSVGAFLTHCGWNSTLEGISAGVPLIVCPLFADQFFNAKLIAEVLRIGVSVAREAAVTWWDEDEAEVLVKMEEVKKAIEMLMGEGEEGEERRNRAREFAVKAKRAMEEGGSSCVDVALFIEDVVAQANKKRPIKCMDGDINGA